MTNMATQDVSEYARDKYRNGILRTHSGGWLGAREGTGRSC